MRSMCRRLARGLAIATSLALASCGKQPQSHATMTQSTFSFSHTGQQANTGAIMPGVWIDTNIDVDLGAGTATSSLPCALMLDYTDNSETFETLVITAVRITYEDGTTEPAAQALALPIEIDARAYETVNSVAGGKVVRTEVRILSGSIPGVVTRAEPLRLQIDGHFVAEDGSARPFTIDQGWGVEFQDREGEASQILQDR